MNLEDGSKDSGQRALGGVAFVGNIESALADGRIRVLGAPCSSKPSSVADVPDMYRVDAQFLCPQPFHIAVHALIYACKAEATGQETNVVGPVYMRQSQDGVAQPFLLCQFLQPFLGLKFVFRNLKPRLQRGGFFTAAGGDSG